RPFPLTFFFFFSPPTAPTEIYTLSLHDALPILRRGRRAGGGRPALDARHPRHRVRARWRPERERRVPQPPQPGRGRRAGGVGRRSEEHTSELQSRFDLVCRLLLEKKKKSRRV